VAKALGIDTAAPVVGVALAGDDELLWSQRVIRGADGVLGEVVARTIRDRRIDRIGVTVGPGAFTGIRVGVGLALGVAMARGIPIVACSSLLARAALVPGEPRVLALLDAKRERVYAALFRTDRAWPELVGDERDARLGDVLPSEPFVAVGEGALVFADALLAVGARMAEDPGASPVLAVARMALAPGASLLGPEEVSIRYLRDPGITAPRS
jgi:tRNA threonylcarbamoyl adenosine modification protein YeaZ